jgi:diacylglycerol kinase family enzyme
MQAVPDTMATDRPFKAPAAVLFIIINPGSGAAEAQVKRDLIARVFEEEGRAHRFVPVASPDELQSATDKAALEAVTSRGILVAVGGDGTINTVAATAMRHGCTLGVLPQGTFNLFGRSHGISQDLETAARALARGQPEPVQVGEANGRLFLVNASLGLYPQLLQDRESFKKQFGRHRWVAIMSGLVTLFEWRRQLTIELESNGERVVLTTPTLFVCNNPLQLERIGIDAHTSGEVGAGLLAAIVAKPIGTFAMLVLLLRGAFGTLGEADQIRSFSFRSLQVRVRRMRRLRIATDGEVGVTTPPVTFTVSSKPLMLVVPRPEDRVPVE